MHIDHHGDGNSWLIAQSDHLIAFPGSFSARWVAADGEPFMTGVR